MSNGQGEGESEAGSAGRGGGQHSHVHPARPGRAAVAMAAAVAAAATATRRRGRRREGRAGVARAAPGVPLGAWLEPRPSGLRVQSGGLSRRSAASDHLQAGGSLSIHRELCAHSPTGSQSSQANAGQAPARARPQAMPERARGWAMAVGAEQPPSARPGERCKRQASVGQSHQPFCRRRTSLIHRK